MVQSGRMVKVDNPIMIPFTKVHTTGSVVCLTTKGRQLELNFEELKPASHVSILGTILNLFDVFVAVFFSVKFLESLFTFVINVHQKTCVIFQGSKTFVN
jgi:hypothetical protein